MTDSTKSILGNPTNQYTFFEPNQILDSKQLNSLAEYLNYQEHLTRVKLLGVGIVGGLQVQRAGNTVIVRQGVGVTTDGDVLMMPADTVFSKFKLYGPASPYYTPFYKDPENKDPGNMVPIFELVRDDPANATIQPLSALDGNLSEMVVVLYMERYCDDPDVCSSTNCDNLGQTAFDNPRVLLVSRETAKNLLKELETFSKAALHLKALRAERPFVSNSVTSPSAIANVYRKPCENICNMLIGNIDSLSDILPAAFMGDFVAKEWKEKLSKHNAQFSTGKGAGIQYFYDFLKDVVDTWNELREVLLDDDSLLCPDASAFPRHLVLGDLTNPTENRTLLFPSPLMNGQSGKQEHAKFLFRKLKAMIEGFKIDRVKQPPADISIRVTPSFTEALCLEERAIPWYYDPDAIRLSWNYRLTRRGEAADISGYHNVPEVFERQIGRYDFFRIEGHQGKTLEFVKKELRKSIVTNNWPFSVHAVLLHTKRQKIADRPNIRFSDLHRLHRVLRKDLELQLAETKVFSEKFKSQIDAMKDKTNFPNTDLEFARVNSESVQAQQPLAKKTYLEYQQAQTAQNWHNGYRTVLNLASGLKERLGDRIQTNYSTAFDSLVTNNNAAILQWVEAQIQSKDDHEDDKLLFPNFREQHPGLEHFGGVTRGGTFVLVYDEDGFVVADFMLSYRWAETAEEDTGESEQLIDPNFKGADLFNFSVKLQMPLDTRVDQKIIESNKSFGEQLDTRVDQKISLINKSLVGKMDDQFKFQNEQIKVFVDYGKVLGSKAIAGQRVDIANPLLRSLLAEVESKQQQVEDLRGLAIDPTLPSEIRDRAQSEMGRVELELAESIGRGTSFLDKSNIGMEAGGDGGKAITVFSQGMDKVSGGKAMESLRNANAGVKSEQLKRIFKMKGI